MSELDKNDQEERGTSEHKTEMANQIASQSRKVASTYQHVEDGLVRIVRWFSAFLDKTLFSRKYSKLVSLILAILFYVIVNYNSQSSLYTNAMQNSRTLSSVTVTAKYNSDTFELSGLPETADITISGDASSVTAAVNSRGVVVADLEGLTEGTHEVELTTEGFGDSVTVTVKPTN